MNEEMAEGYQILRERIAEFERFIKTQDRKLRQQSKECDKAIDRVEVLAKENTELKARLNAINLLTPELEKRSKLKKQQLTNAKEIVREFIELLNEHATEYQVCMCRFSANDFIEKAEAFLKEEANGNYKD